MWLHWHIKKAQSPFVDSCCGSLICNISLILLLPARWSTTASVGAYSETLDHVFPHWSHLSRHSKAMMKSDLRHFITVLPLSPKPEPWNWVGNTFVMKLCECWVTNPQTWEDLDVKTEGNYFSCCHPLLLRWEKSTARLDRTAQWTLEEKVVACL